MPRRLLAHLCAFLLVAGLLGPAGTALADSGMPEWLDVHSESGTSVQVQAPGGSGVVQVVVMSGSQPVAGAQVYLAGGPASPPGTTDATGTVTFTGLRYGTYLALAVSPDAAGLVGSTRVSISTAAPQAAVTVVPGRSAPVGLICCHEPPVTEQSGAISGRICAPAGPGAVVRAEGPGGRSLETRIASDGKLGMWRSYQFTGLAPGVWTLTLQAPGEAAVSQTMTVVAGQTAHAGDFSLACTGGNAPAARNYLGAAMLLAGAGLLVWRRRGRFS